MNNGTFPLYVLIINQDCDKKKTFLFLTFADDPTVSNRTEATEIKGIEQFKIHASTVCIVKTRAIVKTRVSGTWIRHHQFC